MEAVVGSGATIPVLRPRTGQVYPVQESQGSRGGVEYEVANNDTVANLGEKFMAVLTEEGTLRGYGSQCAAVSKDLSSVRNMVGSRHAVCFGLGPNDDQHLIINKVSGEVDRMRDDGINYLQRLKIIPPNQINAVMSKLAEINNGGPVDQGFGRPGR